MALITLAASEHVGTKTIPTINVTDVTKFFKGKTFIQYYFQNKNLNLFSLKRASLDNIANLYNSKLTHFKT